MHEITLNDFELMVASHIGCIRRVASIKRGLNCNKHALKSDWQTDILGACAELAVAKALGVYWGPGVNTFKSPDVGPLQVRSTPHLGGHLIVRANDDDEAAYVLVLCKCPTFYIVGMCRGGWAKQERFFRSGDAGEADCWWVPQTELLPLLGEQPSLSPP